MVITMAKLRMAHASRLGQLNQLNNKPFLTLVGGTCQSQLQLNKIKRNKTSDVTLVWDDGKRVEAHKDNFCRGSDDSEND